MAVSVCYSEIHVKHDAFSLGLRRGCGVVRDAGAALIPSGGRDYAGGVRDSNSQGTTR